MSKYNNRSSIESFKIGDIVEILDFKKKPDYTHCGKQTNMYKYIGNKKRIEQISRNGNLLLVGTNCCYFAPNWVKKI